MLKDFLPKYLCDAIYTKTNDEDINEIRIRLNLPIVVVCNLKTYFLSESGLCGSPNLAIFASREMIDDIIFNASEFSMYYVNDQLKNGYILANGGIRLGVCGEVVESDGEIKTIKNISSICIRIPHQIKGASKPIFKHLFNNEKINNTLIISPPGAGKTTMLRDIVYEFSYHNYPYNIFIADERGEITGGSLMQFNLGSFYDSICFVKKTKSLLLGLRSMSPDIVVTDEIGDIGDGEILRHIITCGVSVIASIHGKNIEDVKNNTAIKDLISNKVFDRYIVLSKRDGVGTIEGVYDKSFSKMYGGSI